VTTGHTSNRPRTPREGQIKAALKKLDRYQQRHPWLGFPIAVQKKFGEDQGGSLAGLIAYYGFFSLFPLLLVFTSILGFVLQGDPSAQQKIVNGAIGQLPVVGEQIRTGALHGSGVALAIGAVAAILSGLGVTLAAQDAFNRVYAVPRTERPNFLKARLRGLATLAVLGTFQVVATAATGFVAGGGVGLAIAGLALALSLNVLLFFLAFRLLTEKSVPTRELWPGVLTAAVVWDVLQTVGSLYIHHVVQGATSTYGTFALVIGLLTWLFLGARVVVYAAEVNVVWTRRLWPRSLTDPPIEADRRALAAMTRIEQHDRKQAIEVSFEPPDDSSQPGENGRRTPAGSARS
jgi:membrane protein